MVRTGKLGLLLTALSVYKMNLTHFEYVSKDKFYVIIRGCSHITSAGRGGVRQMLTKADEGGRGGKPIADKS